MKIYTAVYAGSYGGAGPVPGDSWILVRSDAGSAELESDGIRAVAPIDDVVGPLEPGRPVRILGKGVVPGRIPGFLFRRGVLRPAAPLSRLYLNVSPRHASWALGPLARRLDDLGVPFEMKALADPESYYRSDAAVVYVPSARIHEAVRLCTEAQRTGDLQTAAPVPLLTREVQPGVAVADEPDDVAPVGHSHGAWVTDLLMNALDSASDASGLFRMVEDGIRASGRSPDRPFQRASAVRERSIRAQV